MHIIQRTLGNRAHLDKDGIRDFFGFDVLMTMLPDCFNYAGQGICGPRVNSWIGLSNNWTLWVNINENFLDVCTHLCFQQNNIAFDEVDYG